MKSSLQPYVFFCSFTVSQVHQVSVIMYMDKAEPTWWNNPNHNMRPTSTWHEHNSCMCNLCTYIHICTKHKWSSLFYIQQLEFTLCNKQAKYWMAFTSCCFNSCSLARSRRSSSRQAFSFICLLFSSSDLSHSSLIFSCSNWWSFTASFSPVIKESLWRYFVACWIILWHTDWLLSSDSVNSDRC